MKRVLISVTDKAGIEKFGALIKFGWDIISTGKTAKKLIEYNIPCTLIEEITKFPEMMDGRLKTLHPNIFGGILADHSNPEHMMAIKEKGIEAIDIVVVNLYDFKSKPGIENIDIGGPSLIRAAAKNHNSVTVVVDPDDYDLVISEIEDFANICLDTRRRLALKAFELTESYDHMIVAWLIKEIDK